MITEEQITSLQELTAKYLDDFFKVCPDETESYLVNYILPETLVACLPHDLDTEFYHPYLGAGFAQQIVVETFKKYIQSFPKKLDKIVREYPRDYFDEYSRLFDWVEDTKKVEHATSATKNGRYVFMGFQKVPCRRVSFKYLGVNSGTETRIECVYHPRIDEINEIIFYDQKGDEIINITCFGDDVNFRNINDYGYVRSLNSTIHALNYIFQAMGENNLED